jgi:hypothetical protein
VLLSAQWLKLPPPPEHKRTARALANLFVYIDSCDDSIPVGDVQLWSTFSGVPHPQSREFPAKHISAKRGAFTPATYVEAWSLPPDNKYDHRLMAVTIFVGTREGTSDHHTYTLAIEQIRSGMSSPRHCGVLVSQNPSYAISDLFDLDLKYALKVIDRAKRCLQGAVGDRSLNTYGLEGNKDLFKSQMATCIKNFLYPRDVTSILL